MRLTWGALDERFFETGVDRGVLYTGDGIGVAWNGLTAVNESSTGGDPKPAYIDGYKFRNVASTEEFAASIEAFSAPREFGPCDGSVSLQKGLMATQQPRRAFNFSYRTLIGNGEDGIDHGYKIHLVYNALAGPAQRTNNTIGDSAEATKISWDITTLPPSFVGLKPTSHYIIDSRDTPRQLLAAIENILYGTDANTARMPLVSELVTLFQSEGPLMRTNLVLNPAFRTVSPGLEVRRNMIANPSFRYNAGNQEVRRNAILDPNGATASNWKSYIGVSSVISEGAAAFSGNSGLTATADGTQVVPRIQQLNLTNVAANDTWTLQARVRLVAGTGWAANASPYFVLRGPKTAAAGGGEWTTAVNPVFAPDGSGWMNVTITAVVDPGTAGQMYINIGFTNGSANAPSTAKFQVDQIILEKSYLPLPFFDGSKATADGLTYSWVGTPQNSESIATGLGVLAASAKGYLRNNWRIPGGATDGTDSCLFYIGTVNTSLIVFDSGNTAVFAPGDYASARFRVRLRNATSSITLSANLYAYTSAVTAISIINSTNNIVVPADGSWVDVVVEGTNTAPANTASARLYVTGSSIPTRLTDILEISNVLVEKSAKAFSWFDGASPADADTGWTHAWLSTAHASASTKLASQAASNLYVYAPNKGGVMRDPDTGERRLRLINMGIPSSLWAFQGAADILAPAGTMFKGRIEARVVSSTSDVQISPRLGLYEAAFKIYLSNPVAQTIPADGSWVTLQMPSTDVSPPDTISTATVRVMLYNAGVTPAGAIIELRNVLVEPATSIGEYAGDYFDGSFPDVDYNFYSWAGTPDLSVSRLNTWN